MFQGQLVSFIPLALNVAFINDEDRSIFQQLLFAVPLGEDGACRASIVNMTGFEKD